MLIKNLIYILQSEHYYFFRFLKFAYSHPNWFHLEKGQKIKWTPKVLLIYFATLLLLTFFFLFSFFFYKIIGLVFTFVLGVIFLPFVIGMAFLIIYPFDFFAKYLIIAKAKRIISKSGLVIIGITGSYGKTSTKEILFSILKEKFSVIKTPDNINTDIGVAKFILSNQNILKKNDIFIVEMGAYKMGEIKKMCNLVNPDYSILTGINESHLERFGNIHNIIKAKFELPQNTRETTFLNFDDKNIKNNYHKFNLHKMESASTKEVVDIELLDDFAGINFVFKGMNFGTKLLAEHNIVLMLLGIKLAKKLKMNIEDIKNRVKKIKPLPHRLELIYNSDTNVTIIDDSYNGNFLGFKSGVKVLQRAKQRKVILTPGLVELGDESQRIHKNIGKIYANSADLVLFIKNKGVKYIEEGLRESGFENYKIYNSTKEAHDDLGNTLKRGDTIIFQNDLTDNYF